LRFQTVNLISGPQNLAMGQGFIVLAIEELGVTSSITLDFLPSMRRNTAAMFIKSMEVYEEEEYNPSSNWMKLNLTLSKGTNRAQTLIAFNEYMTMDMNPGYDAGAFSSDAPLRIFTRMPEGNSSLDLSVQALPVENIAEYLVPVGVQNQNASEVTFTGSLEGFGSRYTPLLYDAKNNYFADLSAGSYTVLAGGTEPQTGRFFLRMMDSSKLHKVEFGVTGDGGVISAKSGNVNLMNGELVAEGSAIEISAVADGDKKLLNWVLNGVQIQANNPLIFDRLLEPVNLTAVFGPLDKAGDLLLDSDKLKPGEWDVYSANERIIIKGKMEGTGSVHVIDITGRKIVSQSLNAGSFNQITTSGLQTGVYLIQIIENGRSETKRVYLR
jgi:hypothetical protein